MLNSLKTYTKNNLFAIIASSIIFLLIYITWLATNPIHYDTFLYEATPGVHYDSAQIGRWGLCLFKSLINGWIFNKFLEKILGYIAIICSMIIFGFAGKYLTQKNEKIWPWFGLLIVSSPMVCNMLYFEMMLIGTGMGFLLTALSVLFNFAFIYKKNPVYCLIGIVCGTIAFGCYQAFLNIYISFALLIFVLRYINKKWNLKEILILIAQFIFMYFANWIIANLSGANSSYDYNTITWGSVPIDQSILTVIKSIGKILIDPPYCFTIIYTVLTIATIILATIFLIQKLLNKNYSYLLIWLCIGIFELSTFFIIIVKGGGIIPPRGDLAYAYVMAGNILIIYNILNTYKVKFLKKTGLIIMLICVLFSNISITEKMLYNDYVRNDKDVQVLNEVNSDLHKYDIKPVVFVGYCQPKLNGLVTEDFDTINTSILNEKKMNQISDTYFHTENLINVFKASSINTDLNPASSSQINEATQIAKNMNSYPNPGYIKDCGDYLIVKLGED
ncbi:MAG: glucosyltransferase domain-containing protein [Coriobacteriia bacterium]|nr:glucosyltransferase domain-containing protein [Coriobacteriia bacterium]